MQSADLLIAPRWMLPIAPVNEPLEGHGVVITGGRIVAVGLVSGLESEFDVRERITRPSHVLMPGFVNAHTRASTCLFRGLPVHAPALRWAREILAPAELRWSGRDFVRDGTQLAIAEMLQAGITAFGTADRYPDEVARVAASARVRVAVGLPVAESVGEHADLWDAYRLDPWISLYFAPPAGFGISDALLTRLRSVADELDARIAMPLHETEVEVHDSLSEHGVRPLERLANLGLLRPGFTALHANRLTEDDLAIVEETGISVVACPQSNLRFGSGAAPVSALLRRNVIVGLGTDSPVAAGAFDLFAEARLATMLSSSEETGALCAWNALHAATLGAAQALGLGGTCGSIEPGKAADLVCIDLTEPACQSSSLAEAVLFGATRRDVSDVWTAGRVAVSSSQLVAFDEPELRHLARQWADRIRTGDTE